MMYRIKILLIVGLCVSTLYGSEEIFPGTGTQENHFITIQLEDGQVELNKEQWELLLGSSETLQDFSM